MADKGQTSRFVVLEGLDGAGTTTQATLLAEALQDRDLRVCLTAEPTDGPLGAVCRAHVRRKLTLGPATAALAFTADRSDHLEGVIRPALRAGLWVVCDRYLLSTLAYQGAGGADREWVLALQHGFEVPDLTVFLDVPPEVSGVRVAARPGALDRYEERGAQGGLRDSYLASIELVRARGHRVEVMDGSLPAPELSRLVLARLDTGA